MKGTVEIMTSYPIVQLTKVRDLDVGEVGGRTSYLHSASGLVWSERNFHVIADDSVHMATFEIGSRRPGRLTRLLAENLPRGPALRKRAKPDFEVLVALPPDRNHPYGALLAMGSGSTPHRRRGVLVVLSADGRPLQTIQVDLEKLLFATFRSSFSEVNIEGAILTEGQLILFLRGNLGDPRNAVIRFDAVNLGEALRAGATLPKPEILLVDLGRIEDVPLSFTDAARVGENLLYTAVAERTANAYDDGDVAGSAIGLLSPDLDVSAHWLLAPAIKYEGIAGAILDQGIGVWLVSDADDPSRPSSLYEGIIPLHRQQ
jgi:hypothetical protein